MLPDCKAELYIALADGLVFLCSSLGFWSSKKKYSQLKETEDFVADESLTKKLLETDNATIKLVSVSGTVRALEPPLKSLYHPEIQGVIRNSLKREHKTQKIQGYWSDRTSTLQDKTEFCKFGLSSGTEAHIVVEDAFRVDDLKGVLRQTYDNFIRPADTGFFDKVLSRFHGEVSKGYQETESMLPLNSALVVIGKASLSPDGKKAILSPPDNFPFIFTQSSKEQIVQEYSFWKGFWKATMVISAIVLTGVAISAGKKYYRYWKEHREAEDLRKQAFELRKRRPDQSVAADNSCTVCLSNPRDLIILECGHVCICVECYEALPSPKLCPVCRSSIARVALVYNP
ncbi:unnamed protein product [Dimorphilus gyrociliatus]|uniref:RING-type E3 ubiquitin transferase n=1 Tax=Dimorphilus gyrociliatus TaxID=2664684 RepID=A0A7I8VJ89_9ANNE|nr:unnamed protein product [Dimorphilus gyrociliatus]